MYPFRYQLMLTDAMNQYLKCGNCDNFTEIISTFYLVSNSSSYFLK